MEILIHLVTISPWGQRSNTKQAFCNLQKEAVGHLDKQMTFYPNLTLLTLINCCWASHIHCDCLRLFRDFLRFLASSCVICPTPDPRSLALPFRLMTWPTAAHYEQAMRTRWRLKSRLKWLEYKGETAFSTSFFFFCLLFTGSFPSIETLWLWWWSGNQQTRYMCTWRYPVLQTHYFLHFDDFCLVFSRRLAMDHNSPTLVSSSLSRSFRTKT